MRDPLTVLAEQAAAALGVRAEHDLTGFTIDDFLEWSTADELETVLVTLNLLQAEGGSVARADAMTIVEPAVVRAVQLRRDLGLGIWIDPAPGVEAHIRKRSCIKPWPKTVRDCRCAADAIAEVAASVQRVDSDAVGAARARAEVLHAELEVLHARIERKLVRACARTARLLRESRLVAQAPESAIAERPPEDETLVEPVAPLDVEDIVEVEAPAVRAPSSTGRGRLRLVPASRVYNDRFNGR